MAKRVKHVDEILAMFRNSIPPDMLRPGEEPWLALYQDEADLLLAEIARLRALVPADAPPADFSDLSYQPL